MVPRAMFAADGTMLHCSAKSKLMAVLEQLLARGNVDNANCSHDGRRDKCASGAARKVVIIDGMAELQCLVKPN